MFWNITADNWALIWSAVIGAVVAGGSAALVATWVLGQTNMHQIKLARAQMRQQSKALEAQLQAQKREAGFEREILVRSELIAVVSDFADAFQQDIELAVTAKEAPFLTSKRDGPELENFDRKIAILIQRWRMNLDPIDDADLRNALQDWCGVFGDLIRNCNFFDRYDEGVVLLRRSLGDLQQAAMNYRLTARRETWTSSGTAEFLEESLLRVSLYNMKFHAGGPGNPMYNAPANERRMID